MGEAGYHLGSGGSSRRYIAEGGESFFNEAAAKREGHSFHASHGSEAPQGPYPHRGGVFGYEQTGEVGLHLRTPLSPR